MTDFLHYLFERGFNSCQQAAKAAVLLLGKIHTRMPVILSEEHHEAWLSGEAGKELLVPFPADRMRAWPISARVNSPMNNDPEIMAPIGA